MLCYNAMIWPLENPLSLAAGVPSRLCLVAVLLAVLWAGVFWAMSA